MSLSMYQASVPLFRTLLGALSGVLDKGVAFAEAKTFDPSVLVNARLAPDMFSLARQVAVATSHSAACAARLAGLEPPTWPDTDTTFEGMKARIATAIAYLDGIKPAQIDGSEERAIVADDEDRSASFGEALFERLDRRDVEVVGGFVEQQDIRRLGEGAG